ncbi:MAG: hypothetical protein A2Y65_05455 [Deltaproteobacteria bacterium RBG_13_52_11]|nr:MAG: hypothetical protein A2Y65_05455 [Deltaproteobacteria bacterium RBG_13_52_11]
MIYEGKERRRFQRIFFSLEEGVKGTFAFSDLQKGVLTARIINVSEDGLGLTISKDEKKRIDKGDHLILSHITGIKGLESLINVEAEIKWILDYPALDRIGIGCEILNPPEAVRKKIRTFIDSLSMEKCGRPPEGQTS